MKRVFAAFTACSLLAALLTGCTSKTPSRRTVVPTGQTQETEASGEWARTVQRDGKTWRYNSHLRTVLFLGVDTRDTSGEDRRGVGTGGRSDTIILLIIDPDAGVIQPVTLSRDTMTDVDVYDRDRNYLFSGKMQLTMQYSFGDNPKRSCLLVKKKVSDLLGGLPIHAYCSMTLDGITAASELLGGIRLTLEEDWTDIDPSFTAGSTITMNAETLERFLRYRDTGVSGSNDVRMKRQGWFIRQMFSQMGNLGSAGVEALMKQLDGYVETDMDGDMLKQLTALHISGSILNVPGRTVAGTAHDEYYIDEDALPQFLLELYYTPSAG